MSDDPADESEVAADEEAADVEEKSTETDDAEGEPTDADSVEEEPAEAALSDRIAEYDEALAEEVGDLRRRAEAAEADRDEHAERVEKLESQLTRTRADFQNYKKRAQKRREQERERATEDLVERLVTVRDNLLRALDQDEDVDIRPGVRSTLEEFDRVLETEEVEPIEPEPGEEVDPQRHEVMLRVESNQPEGTVAELYQPGYEMAGKVIRAAQVTVSDGNE